MIFIIKTYNQGLISGVLYVSKHILIMWPRFGHFRGCIWYDNWYFYTPGRMICLKCSLAHSKSLRKSLAHNTDDYLPFLTALMIKIEHDSSWRFSHLNILYFISYYSYFTRALMPTTNIFCAGNLPVTGGIWGPSQYKDVVYQYRDSHVKDKTVSPTVLSLTWESPYLEKTVFILRRGPGDRVRNVESAVLPGYDLIMIGSCQLISYKLAIKRGVCEE